MFYIIVIYKGKEILNTLDFVKHENVYGVCKGVEASGCSYALSQQTDDLWKTIDELLGVILF